jgi:hypothetical protein
MDEQVNVAQFYRFPTILNKAGYGQLLGGGYVFLVYQQND